MRFYEEFVDNYDKLISWELRAKRETNFFKTLFEKNNVKKVLDCSCGTGQHTIIFNQLGFEATGSDISKAMIRKAKENAEKNQITAKFIVADFRNLTNIFEEKFDAIITVGNSLPHLMNKKEIKKAVREMYKLLNSNGTLIIEQRNFDKLIKNNIRFMPMTIREDQAFFYVLDYYPKKITFNVINLKYTNKEFKVFSVDYNPLKKDKLIKIIRKSGFSNFNIYQDYEFNNYDKSKSDLLIIVCKRDSI
ncbi:MAG: class I SAM-dependent methyltransferase [Candidatus Hermodarchaeota archaeon]